MVGNLCTIYGFVCLIIINCLDLFICSDYSRLFGAVVKNPRCKILLTS